MTPDHNVDRAALAYERALAAFNLASEAAEAASLVANTAGSVWAEAVAAQTGILYRSTVVWGSDSDTGARYQVEGFEGRNTATDPIPLATIRKVNRDGSLSVVAPRVVPVHMLRAIDDWAEAGR